MHLISSISIVLAIVVAAAAQLNETAQNATAFALLYGYPLLAFEKLAPALVDSIGVNQINHARALRTAADTEVVKPNVRRPSLSDLNLLLKLDRSILYTQQPSSTSAIATWSSPSQRSRAIRSRCSATTTRTAITSLTMGLAIWLWLVTIC